MHHVINTWTIYKAKYICTGTFKYLLMFPLQCYYTTPYSFFCHIYSSKTLNSHWTRYFVFLHPYTESITLGWTCVLHFPVCNAWQVAVLWSLHVCWMSHLSIQMTSSNAVLSLLCLFSDLTLILLTLLLLWAQLKAPTIGTPGGPIPSILLCKKNCNLRSKGL